MTKIKLRATSAFGIESLVAYELRDLGYNDLTTHNGYVDYDVEEKDILRSNLWLRCSDRVLWVLDSFDCKDFDDLFEGVSRIPWSDILPKDAAIAVKFKSYKSLLTSTPHGQSVTKKAIIEVMKKKFSLNMFPETGPRYTIEVALRNDKADICLNTSGEGLHKRGYRQGQGDAPLKETLAAAMIKLSRWKADRPLVDPFCGSGTIAIEAALMGINKAPGLLRTFNCEKWSHLPKEMLIKSREEANDLIDMKSLDIYASDNDYRVFKKAQSNAALAGVEDLILYEKKDVYEFKSKKKFGCIITNPPYGERIGDKDEASDLYKTLGQRYKDLEEWSAFILTTSRSFEKDFAKKADKNRKLYNGTIQCYLYQYFGKMR